MTEVKKMANSIDEFYGPGEMAKEVFEEVFEHFQMLMKYPELHDNIKEEAELKKEMEIKMDSNGMNYTKYQGGSMKTYKTRIQFKCKTGWMTKVEAQIKAKDANAARFQIMQATNEAVLMALIDGDAVRILANEVK